MGYSLNSAEISIVLRGLKGLVVQHLVHDTVVFWSVCVYIYTPYIIYLIYIYIYIYTCNI